MQIYVANTNPPKRHLVTIISHGCYSYFKTLLARFQEAELISQYASGTEEVHTEIATLLIDIIQLISDHEIQKKEGKTLAKSRKEFLHE